MLLNQVDNFTKETSRTASVVWHVVRGLVRLKDGLPGPFSHFFFSAQLCSRLNYFAALVFPSNVSCIIFTVLIFHISILVGSPLWIFFFIKNIVYQVNRTELSYKNVEQAHSMMLFEHDTLVVMSLSVLFFCVCLF